jgi:hypothetical protein
MSNLPSYIFRRSTAILLPCYRWPTTHNQPRRGKSLYSPTNALNKIQFITFIKSTTCFGTGVPSSWCHRTKEYKPNTHTHMYIYVYMYKLASLASKRTCFRCCSLKMACRREDCVFFKIHILCVCKFFVVNNKKHAVLSPPLRF